MLSIHDDVHTFVEAKDEGRSKINLCKRIVNVQAPALLCHIY